MSSKLITYVYKGMIEVGCGRRGRKYKWVEGFCEEGTDAQPWITMDAAKYYAKERGCVASFSYPSREVTSQKKEAE